ncbi:hypothetical protein GGR57DRAFT_60674 [Xylariaceae sp. FL1272]|nr:hypothetical protein GGR57DRAFT_60674 [Xylariaceae sp. FL1272]
MSVRVLTYIVPLHTGFGVHLHIELSVRASCLNSCTCIVLMLMQISYTNSRASSLLYNITNSSRSNPSIVQHAR